MNEQAYKKLMPYTRIMPLLSLYPAYVHIYIHVPPRYCLYVCDGVHSHTHTDSGVCVCVCVYLISQAHEVVSHNEPLEDHYPVGVAEPVCHQVSQARDGAARVIRQLDEN